ncbi:hypothetical protein GYB22_12480 [bacterium]|nr:hypothetical protein [bacterium]
MGKHLILKLILLSSLFLTSIRSNAYDTLHLKDIKTITAFSADAKGNLYVADGKNTLYKLNSKGKVITNVNTKVYGTISSIDCSNPFELYIYYSAQNILVYYDNMLNIRGETRFNSMGFNTISAVARSFDNGIWVYDYSDFQLKKLNKEGEVQSSSGNLSRFTSGQISPYKIIDFKNQIYLADSNVGIMVFDIFGTYIKTLPILNSTDFTVSDSAIHSLQHKAVLSYNFISFQQKNLPKPKAAKFIGRNTEQLLIVAETNIFSISAK